MCTQASGIGSTKQFSIFRALPFFRRLFSVLFWFQYIIFTLHSQSNYFFILNHHYRIGSAVCLYHLAVQCAFRSPIALYLSLSLCVCLLETGVFKNDTDYTVERVAQFFSVVALWCWENVWPLVTGWLLMVLLHLAMLRVHCDGHHSRSANVCMCFVTNTGSMPNASAATATATVAAVVSGAIAVVAVLLCLCFVCIDVKNMDSF